MGLARGGQDRAELDKMGTTDFRGGLKMMVVIFMTTIIFLPPPIFLVVSFLDPSGSGTPTPDPGTPDPGSQDPGSQGYPKNDPFLDPFLDPFWGHF